MSGRPNRERTARGEPPFTPLHAVMEDAHMAGASARAGIATVGREVGRRPGCPPVPAAGTHLTEGYARMAAREAYLWAWPLINLYERRLASARVPEPGRVDGAVPVAPLNRLSMLDDLAAPAVPRVACPDPDLLHGAGALALDRGPVVVQVPDFGGRFWVYQAVDLRTDGFAELGVMYGTEPGFYLLAGPGWSGRVPEGIARVFRSPTYTGMVVPRVFQGDTLEDRRRVREVIGGIDMYPLREYDGTMKRRDWSAAPRFPGRAGGGEEVRWASPETFLERLPRVLRDAPPLPGEELRYGEMLGLVLAAERDPGLAKAVLHEAAMAERDLVGPLLEFRNFGVSLPHHWTTVDNGAAFGSDYFTRAAAARADFPVARPNEARPFYQDRDANGWRLNARWRYEVRFDRGALPPVEGLWSLALYDDRHFAGPNAAGRWSLGTRSRELRTAGDGSLTLYLQPDEPEAPAPRAHWLPSPPEGDFSLVLRAWWPGAAILKKRWTPPRVARAPA